MTTFERISEFDTAVDDWFVSLHKTSWTVSANDITEARQEASNSSKFSGSLTNQDIDYSRCAII